MLNIFVFNGQVRVCDFFLYVHTVHVIIYFVHRLSERKRIPQIFLKLLIRGVSCTEFEQKVNNMSITSKCMLQIFIS